MNITTTAPNDGEAVRPRTPLTEKPRFRPGLFCQQLLLGGKVISDRLTPLLGKTRTPSIIPLLRPQWRAMRDATARRD